MAGSFIYIWVAHFGRARIVPWPSAHCAHWAEGSRRQKVAGKTVGREAAAGWQGRPFPGRPFGRLRVAAAPQAFFLSELPGSGRRLEVRTVWSFATEAATPKGATTCPPLETIDHRLPRRPRPHRRPSLVARLRLPPWRLRPAVGPVGRGCCASAWSPSRSKPTWPSAALPPPPSTCGTPAAADASSTRSAASETSRRPQSVIGD